MVTSCPPACWTRASRRQDPRYLVHTIRHRLQRELPGPVHRLPVVRGAPAGAVDVDELGHVADGGGLDDVRHERLVQHPDTCGHAAGKHGVLVPSSQETRGREAQVSLGCGWRVFRPGCPGDAAESGVQPGCGVWATPLKDQEEGTDGPTHPFGTPPSPFLTQLFEDDLIPLPNLATIPNGSGGVGGWGVPP